MLRTFGPRLGWVLVGPIGHVCAAPQHYEFPGTSPNEGLGISVAGVADLDGDGVRDLVVGAYLDDTGGTNSGCVRIYSGATGQLVHFLPGAAPGDQLGYSVADAGDVNRDGFGDVIAGAWVSDVNGLESGRARVYSGIDGSLLFDFPGPAAGNRFGGSVAGGTDINQDGWVDLIVGAPLASATGTFAGEVRVYSGRTGALLRKVSGLAPGDQLGYSVAGLADLDGDGAGEFLIGAPYADNNGIDSGRVSVHSGSNSSVLSFLDGEAEYDELGIAVGRAGDLDGDTVEDWLASAWRHDGGGNEAGRVHVISGFTGTTLRTIDGPVDGFGLGRGAVSGIGDVNGDGTRDLLVGSPLADVEGGNSGSVDVYSGADGSLLHSFVWADPGDRLGQAVSPAGDINADGVEDVLIGAPTANEGAPGSGGAYVFFGGCWMKGYCTSNVNSSGERGRLRAEGSNSVSTNSMRFVARSCARRQFGIVFYGPTQVQIPLGQGILCVGGGGVGHFRYRQVVPLSPDGSGMHRADFSRPPSNVGPGAIVAGSVWNFQFWFRDPRAGNPTTNLTDAVQIEFCP